jgi:transcriptional regulator with XRE-family HTH domain
MGHSGTAKMVATRNRTRKRTKIHPIDIHVGQRLRELRLQAALGLEALGTLVGVSAQQIQKYELGQDRISASRLYLLAGALQVPLADFFQGLPKRLRIRGAKACPTSPC